MSPDRWQTGHPIVTLSANLAYIHVGQDNRITELWSYLSSVHTVHHVSESDIPNVCVKIFQTMISLWHHLTQLQRFHFPYVLTYSMEQNPS